MIDYDKVVKELIGDTSQMSIFKSALNELIPHKLSDAVVYLLILMFSIIVSARIVFYESTLVISLNVIKELLSVQLTLFGCIFTVYSISLAFFSDNYLKRLSRISNNHKNSSLLTTSIKYYESALFLYFIGISLSIISMVILTTMDENFRLFNNDFDPIIALTLLSLYLIITFRILFEIKSTIYNTINLFRVHIAYKLLDFKNDVNDQP